jgi:hypothetical protein
VPGQTLKGRFAVSWGEYPPSLQSRIDRMAATGDCAGLDRGLWLANHVLAPNFPTKAVVNHDFHTRAVVKHHSEDGNLTAYIRHAKAQAHC